MVQHRKYLFAFLAIFITVQSFAQDVPLGSWKDYLSYRNGITVTEGNVNGNNVVYCVAGSGLFSYNTGDNSVQKYSRVTGLSDVAPTVAKFDNLNGINSLLIGYGDGNIDVLSNKTITNVNALLTFPEGGSKTINGICFNGNYAYIAWGQGILQFDMTQDVVQNTFTFGPGGTALNVRGVTTYNDTIFAATDNGIYLASLSDPDINNFADWHRVPNPTVAWGKYNTITTVGDSVYANWSNFYTNGAGPAPCDTTYVYYKGRWTRYLNSTTVLKNFAVFSLESSFYNNKSHLVVSGYAITYGLFCAFDESGNQTFHVATYSFPVGGGTPLPYDAIIDAQGNGWIADNTYGLVKVVWPYYGFQFAPQGPYSNGAFAMAASHNNLYVAAGGYDANYTATPEYQSIGLSYETGGTWNYIANPSAPIPPNPYGLTDLSNVAVDPWNPQHFYAGSWGGGLLEYLNGSIVNVWDSANSSIQNINFPNYVNWRIGGICYDTLGNVWVTNALTATKYLSVRKPNLSWLAMDFKPIGIAQSENVTQVMVTQSQAKWMLFPGYGILAYQDFGTFAAPSKSNTTLITTATGGGGLPDLNVLCMAQDLNGAVWVGTDERVVVFYSPDNVWDGNKDWDAQNVYVQQTGYTQYLMQNQTTTAIAVDGANRKWIGTQGGGVFLMSADGTQQIYNFTSSNSPLLSNNILSIAINQTNGEVFFGTDKGIVSFRGNSTEGLSIFGKVYTFPDPVPHGYEGPIAITNLVTNADVKITTINGELVYHTTALGGQAVWYGNNFNGQRVQTGVYLVFCSSPDGTQNVVSKLLFIN